MKREEKRKTKAHQLGVNEREEKGRLTKYYN